MPLSISLLINERSLEKMSIELVIVWSLLMLSGSSYFIWKQGRDEYDNGFLDAIQLHAEGRLFYSIEDIGDDEGVLTIEVFDE